MVYSKEKMLLNLKNKGLNIFNYKILHTSADLYEYHRFHKKFTIRFTKEEYCQNLPFYVITESILEERLNNIGMEANYMECAMLVSDGIVYEDNQVLNFVFYREPGGKFILEYRFGKETQRQMYDKGVTTIIGNLYQEKKDWTDFVGEQKNMIGFSDLEYILNYIAKTDIYNKYVECTLYDVPVGINKERVIVWGY